MNLEALDLVVRTVAYPVSAAICLNQVEELFIDASYFARGLHRRDRRRVSAEELRGVEQKRIAILVPAWHEAGVIDQMVERNVASIDYDASRYTFFIGTYPNDPETTGCVEALARRFPNVRPVQVPHEGPTSKADCLNAVHRAICEEERRLGGRYDILVLHDSEDVIHPLALRLYSRLIPRYEFVQTPVFSLELRARNAVGGTYIDEFAEHHLKELRLREAMAGVVPSAGVGTAFERAAFEEVAAASGREPFDPTSLTEDYEIGVKFRLAGRRVHFACATVEREAVSGSRREIREDFIATRELFPDRFTASVRQRARWTLGITLQSWARTGWRGPLPVLYSLWRDRKGLGNALLIVAAYALVLYVAARYALTRFAGAPASALCPPGSVLEALFLVNLCGMIWRAAMKGHFVYQLYGATQAFLSFPRAVLGNFISVAATSRAVVTWLGHVMAGRPLRWDKTTHAFPTPAQLARRPRLGEILVGRAVVSQGDLDTALQAQARCGLPLGEVIEASGLATEREVVSALAEQHATSLGALDLASIPPDLLLRMTEAEAEALGVLPIARIADTGEVVLATSRPLSEEALARAERLLGAPVHKRPAMERQLRRARSLAYRTAAASAPARRPLGDRLVAAGRLSRHEVDRALDQAAETGEMLGEFLLRTGLTDERDISEAFAPDGLGYRSVSAEEGDPAAVALLGYSFCALHEVVPLRTRAPDGAVLLTCVRPLHRVHERDAAAALGAPVRLALAPAVQVRVALAVAIRRAPAGAAASLDDEELAVLARKGMCGDRTFLLLEAQHHGVSPIDRLAARGELSLATAAALRAEALHLPVARGEGAALHPDLLPPALARRGVVVEEASPGELLLAAACPTAELAREAAFLLPGWRLGWLVSDASRSPGEGIAHA